MYEGLLATAVATRVFIAWIFQLKLHPGMRKYSRGYGVFNDLCVDACISAQHWPI